MNKEHLRTLLARYRNGDCTDREKHLVEQWFMTLDKDGQEMSDREGAQMEERIWNEIQVSQVKELNLPSSDFSFRWSWLAAAMILFATVWAGYSYYHRVNPALHSAEAGQIDGFITSKNLTDSMQVIRLSDGTEVRLAPSASVSYPAVFEADQRVVNLTGKAFFKVVRRVEQPFFVHTGEVVTKVLGTSFWVTGQQNSKAVEVSVVTGKVSVFQRNESSNDVTKSGVILTANQKVKYSGESREFVTSLVANPVLITPVEERTSSDQSFLFEDAPLITVVKKLQDAYGIEIILENEGLNGCLITADINSQPLFTKLELLCSSLSARYEVRGTKILVTGKGCLSDHLNPKSDMQ